MKGLIVDSNVLLDVFLDDVKWADWSESKLEEYGSFLDKKSEKAIGTLF